MCIMQLKWRLKLHQSNKIVNRFKGQVLIIFYLFCLYIKICPLFFKFNTSFYFYLAAIGKLRSNQFYENEQYSTFR